MTRTRIALLAVLTVTAGWLAFQRFQQLADERALEAANEAARAMSRAFVERRQLAEQQAPHSDRALASLSKAFPRPESAWRSGEEAYYEGLLSKGRFDFLVVPFQVQDYALDRSTRSLMTAELALAIGAAEKKVPDPYLVARALGDGERRLNAERINRLADKLRVGRIVWGYVGHSRDKNMRITIQYQDRTEDPRAPRGAFEARQFEKVPFSEEDPPADVFQRMLPEVLKTIGIDFPAPTSRPESRFDSAAKLPLSPMSFVSGRPEPARDAYALQLLAALAPVRAERLRERLIEKSILAILAMSPASPDYRTLKARALMQMGQRPAALKALGVPESDEEKHLFALLNGNLPEVERYSAKIKPGARAIVARLELNEIASAYGVRTQMKSVQEAKNLKLAGQVWPFLAARAFTDWDAWSQHENGRLKVLLDREFPIPSFTAERIVRGAASLDDMSKVRTALDLSVLDHVRRYSETQGTTWCCEPITARLTALDYLDFLENVGTDNLVRRAYLVAWAQALPQEALDFLARIDSVYRDQPQLTVERARAELQLAKSADGARKDGLLKAAYDHALNALYWEQGQTRTAVEAWEVLYGVDRRDYGYPGNLYGDDHPFRSFYPGWGGDWVASDKARLQNSTFDFSPVTQLRELLGEQRGDWSQFEEVLKSIENRFAGSPQRVLLLARESARKGDIRDAQRRYREDIKSHPGHWQSYADLGKILFEEGNVGKAAQVFMSYPEFAKRAGENVVALSNHAFEAGSLFYWRGNLEKALPLYRIAAGLRTGSNASLSSEIRLNLANGDYAAALTGSLERARRYNTAFAYRDYLGMLHAMGHSQEAWDAFNTLIGQISDSELWETPLVGHRMAGATESEIAEWAARDPMRKSGYAGIYLLRAGVTDRMPTQGLTAAVAVVERPVWKLESGGGIVVRPSVDGKVQRILNSPRAPGSVLPLGVFDSAKKTTVKSDLVYFSEAYRAMRTGDFAGANRLFEEALELYDMRDHYLGYLLPYYAFAASKSGNSVPVSARLDKFDAAYQRFDYHLARAAVAGLAGKTAESVKHLNLALYRRLFTQARPLYTEYQFAEICEWLYEATRNAKYRDAALSWAKSVQAFNPWFSWPYAMEAKLSMDKDQRNRAIAMAYYLDKKSERLAKVPKGEIDAAVKAFGDRNLFLRTRKSAKESST